MHGPLTLDTNTRDVEGLIVFAPPDVHDVRRRASPCDRLSRRVPVLTFRIHTGQEVQGGEFDPLLRCNPR